MASIGSKLLMLRKNNLLASGGNDMIEVTLKIENGPKVYDYLTATDGSFWKLDNFRARNCY
jgi:hypothetical protein